MSAFRIIIEKNEQKNVGFRIEGQPDKDELLGCLALAQSMILNPPEQPRVVAAPAGTLRQLPGLNGAT